MIKPRINRKGIILAGGLGTRLYPVTKVINKQLLLVYDKPMFFYSLSTLMWSGIHDILIITSKEQIDSFKKFFGDGSCLGISIQYSIQKEPKGIPEAFLIASEFINSSPCALILGDNLFHGSGFISLLDKANLSKYGAVCFSYPVADPSGYGLVEFDSTGKVISLEEKPKIPKSNNAITGLYFYDSTVVQRVKGLKVSSRGELEITSLNNNYLMDENLEVIAMGRGMTWLDNGKIDSLHDAATYVRTLEQRQGLKVGCPEETAWRNGWINDEQLISNAKKYESSGYGKYLYGLLNNNKF